VNDIIEKVFTAINIACIGLLFGLMILAIGYGKDELGLAILGAIIGYGLRETSLWLELRAKK
jgi:prepilin signal peptidase PulO-like enzyme (type II secretory pathway)